MHSEHQAADTHPVINGGCYRHSVTGEEAVIMGVLRHPVSGNLQGNLYAFKRGPMPTIVVENTFGFASWELYRCGGTKNAEGLVSAHKRKTKAKAEAAAA